MNKRGEGEQFNWIFVIVSGAIILGFFIMFTFRYISLQEKKQDVESVRFFGGKVLAASSRLQVGSGGASVDSNEQEGLRFGYFVNLGYKCIGNDSTILINEGDTAWYKLSDEVVFMNDEMRVNSLDLWVVPWNFPFYVTNFIYLADPKTNFYLVYEAGTKEFVDNLDISSAFKVEKVSLDQLDFKSNSKVVYFTKIAPSGKEVSKKNITNVDFVYINIEKKEATFLDLEKDKWSTPVKFYTSKDNNGQLLGAIFSNDKDNFACSINTALREVKQVSSLYSKRAELLGQLDRRSECHYNEISRTLNTYSTGNFNLIDKINEQNLAGAGCIWVF